MATRSHSHAHHEHDHEHEHGHQHDHAHGHQHDHAHTHEHKNAQVNPESAGETPRYKHDDHASHDPHDAHDHFLHRFDAAGSNAPFVIGILLNTAFVVIEAVYGLMSESMALMADAVHNLGDVLGLLLAWAAAVMARRPPSLKRTYGYGKATVLSALINALLVFFAVGGVAWEAFERLSTPNTVNSNTVIWVAAIGVVVNSVSALFFLRGAHGGHGHGGHGHAHEHGGSEKETGHVHKHGDVNMQGAFTHLIADALVSVGVVVTGIAMKYSDWYLLDPIVSLVVSLIILWTTSSMLREALNLVIDGVPSHIDTAAVRKFLQEQPHVSSVHDLHIWSMSSTEVAMTAHIVMEYRPETPAQIQQLAQLLHEKFEIAHPTIQIDPCESCGVASMHPMGNT